MDADSNFELDTSGVVERGQAYGGRFVWDDFLPFAKGYTRAALQSVPDLYLGAPDEFHRDDFPSFDDLAGKTVTMILRDCEDGADGERGGQLFWDMRQRGEFGLVVPPIRIHLNDDGKIVFGAAPRHV